jgi:glyoxylase-like metal-dependent hydrolase (beta-lactamase superfamily II)
VRADPRVPAAEVADTAVGKGVQQEAKMSLDNTPHPGRPEPDEPVPSRYALKVGEIDVMVVSDGVLPIPAPVMAHNVDPAVRAAWLNDMFLPPDVLEWPLNVVVVRSGSRTILIDAGLGADPDLHLPRAGRLAQRLDAAGIDLASVTDVVLTHMHMDHIGGLARRRDEGSASPGPAGPPGGRRGQVLGVARFLSHLDAAGLP